MTYQYVILGAGRQGVALAFDLAEHGEPDRICLADADPQVADAAVQRLMRLLPHKRSLFCARTCNVANAADVGALLRGANVVLSAVPYRFNVALTDAAVAAGASFCDLGGNTDVVRQQLARHDRAAAAGLSVVPDCGLAPGLGNILAAHGIASLDEPEHVHIRCGGLPQTRVGPLGYKLVFNFEGLINEYSGYGEFLRAGHPARVLALTELEELEFPPPVGRCEAAVTSGGTSTCPQTFAGRVQTYDYKTVRYPGHFGVIRTLFELGCFETRPIALAAGAPPVAPNTLLRKLFEERLSFPEVRDLVVLRVSVAGRHAGQAAWRQYDLLDFHDERTGLTAMERTTAFPAALVAHLQARRLIAPGARPLEAVLPLQTYVDELPAHDIQVAQTAG